MALFFSLALQCAFVAVAGASELQDGLYAIRNVKSGMYLDVHGGSTQNAANVEIGDTTSSSRGHWHLRAIDGSAAYTIQSALSGLFLSTPVGAGSVNGANVFVWSSAALSESLWKLRDVSNAEGMTFSLENVKTGLVLSVAGASAFSGANVHLWNSSGFLESQWQFVGKGVCHDAVVGDMCYNDTIWAKSYAIHTRPEWYSGLTHTSSFADFQAHLHHCFWGRCPMPCASTTTYSCQMIGRFWSDVGCQDALVDSKCHQEVTWAMDYGIHQHPEWYQSLTNQSSFREFQATIFQGEKGESQSNHCHEPCCHDTLPGERCHEDATWAMLYGINIPEVSHWYPPSLTNQSSLAEFQAYLHLCFSERCPEPCVSTEIMALPHNASLGC